MLKIRIQHSRSVLTSGISIENPKGSTRSGKRPDGTEWSHDMSDHYGYIKRTTGADNEHIDTYIGNNPKSDHVFVVDQLDQQTGRFDEHKVMLGFNDLESATKAYQSNFDDGWKVGPIKSMSMDEFKSWLKDGDTTKPTAGILNFSKNVKKNVTTQVHSDVEVTHNIPEKLLNQSHNLGDVVEDLAGMSSDVETDTQYSESLLRKIAKLNPDIEVIFINNPKLASGLSEGGHYPFTEDGSEKVYIYPQGNWESSILNLVNHELVHAVTHKAIAQNKVSKKDLSFLNHFSETLTNWMFRNPMALDEWIESRFDYGIRDKYHNELIAVFTAETDVRKALTELQGQLANESEEQARNLAGSQKNDNGELQQTPSRDTGNNEGATTEGERSAEDRGTQYQRQNDSNRTGKTRAEIHLLDEFDNVVQRIMALNDVQREQSRNITDSKRGRSTEITSLAEREVKSDKVSTKGHETSQNTERSVKNLAKTSSNLDTIFGVLPQSNAIERILSFFNHLKMTATQDSSSSGRFTVHLDRGKTADSFKLQVVSNFGDLPEVIQQAATYQDENGKTQNYSVSGVWHDDTLYVVTDQINGDRASQFTTSDAYEELLTHEIIGHYGVQRIFGTEYKNKFQQLYNALGGEQGILKIAHDNGVDMEQFKEAYIDPFKQGVEEGYYDAVDAQQASVSELFAFVAQNAEKKPFVRQKLKEVLGYIRQWLREHGLMKLLKYNDADIMMFIAEARKAVVDRDVFGKFENQTISKNNSDKLFSRGQSASRTNTTAKDVRNKLVDRFGNQAVTQLEKQGKLEILDTYHESGVEGFFQNGKVTLVADALNTESIIPTFLHELGGHAGFQNMMKAKQYADLMRQFDRLVEQNNPIALEAKRLSEREFDPKVRRLEMLPYLLTLASNTQVKNAIHKGNVKRLISDLISKVKAWIFDRLGVNINLNPDDMVALAERMIDRAAKDSYSEIPNNSAQYSLNEKSHAPFQKAIDDVIAGSAPAGYIRMGKTPDVLKMLGLPDTKVSIKGSVIEKIMSEHLGIAKGINTNIHNLTPDTVRQLPKQLNNPVAVFKSAQSSTNANGYLVLTELSETDLRTGKDKPIIAALNVSLAKDGIEIINISSVYGRSLNQLQTALNNDILYWHKTKGQQLLNTLKLQLPQDFTSDADLSNTNIKTNEDLVKYQEQKLYSRQSMQDTIDRLSQNLKAMSVQSIKDKTGYKWTDWLGIALSGLGRRQLTEIYSKILPQLTRYNELAAQMDADKNDAGAEADTIVREWSKLKQDKELAELMHDSTLAQIDPSKPFATGDNRLKYNQLRQAYDSLDPEAQAMYKQARDAYKKHYSKVHQAIKERILRSELSSQKKADLLKQMDDNFFNGYVKGVYFPLARFGKYVVIMRNSNNEVQSVSRAETMGEAQSLRSELMQKYPHYKVDRVILDKEFNPSRDAVGRGFMTSLFAEVDNLGLSTAEQAEFEDTLSQLYLSSLPDLSWAKHGIHRKGTAGFSQDARRAFAQNMFHGAGYLAKLRYGDQLAEQLDQMQKHANDQAKVNPEYDQPKAQRVIDEMNKRHDLLMNPKSHPLSSALTSLGFIYYLGLSPAAAMVNLSQTALVAYPIMGAKWGFDKAATELLKASNDFRKGVEFHKVKWEGTKTGLYKTMSADISKFLSKDEKKAYDDAVARGVIDVTQAHDLAGIAQGEDSGIMWKTRPIMRAASVMFHHAERFNREVTFIAAYRLARKAGSNHTIAFDQAVDATYKGHFDYSSGNRPCIMQGNVAKVLLLFKQFGQNMIYTLARQTYQSIKGETKAERKEALKSLGGILVMHMSLAGALGLPLVGMLLSAASAMGGDDDDPWDAEIALRNYLAEAFGPTISNLLMKGAPHALTPIDMSGRVGINNLLLPDVQEGLEGQRWAESAMAGALGPVAGIGTNIVKGTQEISEGRNLRGLETMLPVFLKNFAKIYRYGEEGVQDKTGISIVDEVKSMDLLVQGMGFSPADVRTAYEGKTAIYQLDKKLNERRGRLMALWSRARMMDDQGEMDSVWSDIQQFNDKNPSRRITRVNLQQSYRNRQRRIDKAEDGIYLTSKHQDAREAGYFAFGE
ncbi:PLxRFG domain-containing protein [Acinetobacter ursingii]|nr:PLxRFG domain-containing protein [Acinetobacter ursingii]MCH2003979.1 PLxRFG domain-containing protein [Acinetobacter ursingii]MCU4380707.1 PLxRFG domain-containing protein [Acinetobacter ursingii]MCU4608271.1 PLxRFG domain-containing protein [Acinetobacter ursingii]